MTRWLFKSEPTEWSWSDQQARGTAGEEWTGVRNYQARNVMRQMAEGDLGFFYHSQKDKALVGIVEVCATVHPDSTDDSGKWECVDIRAVRPLPSPVTLAQCKAEPRLAQMALVKNTRLSVQPVTEAEWDVVLELAGAG